MILLNCKNIPVRACTVSERVLPERGPRSLKRVAAFPLPVALRVASFSGRPLETCYSASSLRPSRFPRDRFYPGYGKIGISLELRERTNARRLARVARRRNALESGHVK